MAERMILRAAEVAKILGCSRATIYVRVRAGAFPKPLHLGKRQSGWTNEEVQEWIDDKVVASRGEAARPVRQVYAPVPIQQEEPVKTTAKKTEWLAHDGIVEEMYLPAAVAELLNIGYLSVLRRAKDGRLKSINFGTEHHAKPRFRKADVEAYAKANERRPPRGLSPSKTEEQNVA